jgi:hypothetical protein
MKCFIHIGMHKTGTSSIQSYLSKNSDKIKEKKDVLYVSSGRNDEKTGMHAGHHKLAWSIVKRYSEKCSFKTSNIWWNVLDEIENSNKSKAIISSEFFWAADRSEIKRLKNIFKKHDVEIIIYFRNQMDMAISIYKQAVKTGNYYKSIRDFSIERSWYFDYYSISKKWIDVFGSNRINMEIFEKAKKDLINHFANVIGLEIDSHQNNKQNVSPSGSVIHLIRGLNTVERVLPDSCGRFIHRARRNIVTQRQPGKSLSRLVTPLLPSSIAGSAERDRFRQMTEEMRARFLKAYIPSEDHHLFDV